MHNVALWNLSFVVQNKSRYEANVREILFEKVGIMS